MRAMRLDGNFLITSSPMKCVTSALVRFAERSLTDPEALHAIEILEEDLRRERGYAGKARYLRSHIYESRKLLGASVKVRSR